LLFLTDATLRGRKQHVYILMKILKLCTASTVTSYKIKFAVERMLNNVDPDKIGMGNAVRKVMEYKTIRGKFASVHTDLEKKGITGLEVTDDQGFLFVGYNKG
jgi:hypothetical protein